MITSVMASIGPALLPTFGWQETLVIFAVIPFVFVPQTLPEIAEALGRSIRKFKAATSEIKADIESDDSSKSK